MNIDFDIKKSLIYIIMNNRTLAPTFSKTYPNTKYLLEDIITDILYVLKTGISWRNLRSHIKWQSVWKYYTMFVKCNIFEQLYNSFRNKYIRNTLNANSNTTLLIDSTIIYNRYAVTKLGRNKFYKNKKCTKLSLLTDINGFPLSLFLIKGNYHDNSTFHKHIKDVLLLLPNNKCKILADKGYSSCKNYSLLDSVKMDHIIPPTRNMKIHSTYKYSKEEYIKRIKIEHIFAHLKKFRRIECRYDKYIPTYKGFLYLGLAIIMQRIVNKI